MTVITAALWHVTVFVQLDTAANSVCLAVLFMNCMQFVFADKHALPSCWTLHKNNNLYKKLTLLLHISFSVHVIILLSAVSMCKWSVANVLVYIAFNNTNNRRQCLWCFHPGTAIVRVHPVHLMNAEQRQVAANLCTTQSAWDIDPPIGSYSINMHHRHLLLLCCKADTHFTVPL